MRCWRPAGLARIGSSEVEEGTGCVPPPCLEMVCCVGSSGAAPPVSVSWFITEQGPVICWTASVGTGSGGQRASTPRRTRRK